MSFRLIVLVCMVGLIACFSPPKAVNPELSPYYFRKGNDYYFIRESQDFSPAEHKLQKTDGELEVLAPLIAADRTKIYFLHNPQAVADRSSFSVRQGIPLDKNHVYRYGLYTLDIVPVADPSSFEYITVDTADKQLWGKDKSRYFLYYKPVTTHYNSFTILKNGLAFDSLSVYCIKEKELQKVGTTNGNARKISPYFFRDDSTVYYNSPKTGFQKLGLQPGSRITVIRDEEISVDKQVLSALK